MYQCVFRLLFYDMEQKKYLLNSINIILRRSVYEPIVPTFSQLNVHKDMIRF